MKEEETIRCKQHYYRVPPEQSKTREDCWQALSDYMNQEAVGRIIAVRDHPQVYSELDFDTKEMVHIGFVRFSVLPDVYLTSPAGIPLGSH